MIIPPSVSDAVWHLTSPPNAAHHVVPSGAGKWFPHHVQRPTGIEIIIYNTNELGGFLLLEL